MVLKNSRLARFFNKVDLKEIRKNLKSKLVHALGGSCVCCGYNKSLCALTFHHLDPSEKKFTIGKVKVTNESLIEIVEETKKCVLVCNNCHSEINAGLREVPEKATRFDEKKLM